MKKSTVTKHKVTPFNIRNGNKAPYFMIESSNGMRKDEIEKAAHQEFKNKSSLSRFDNWNIDIERV